MKKILTFLLVLFYCISLASCSPGTNNNGSDNDANTGTEEPTGIRTTVTKDEWKRIGESDNFSLSAIEGVILKYADGCMESNNEDGSTGYYATIDGVTYIIEKTDEKYVASRPDEEDPFLRTDLAGILSLSYNLSWNDVYDKLIYIEESKTYRTVIQISSSDEVVDIEVECENGNIKKMRIYIVGRETNEPLSFPVTFYDFGTTVVAIPEYTFADNQ